MIIFSQEEIVILHLRGLAILLMIFPQFRIRISSFFYISDEPGNAFYILMDGVIEFEKKDPNTGETIKISTMDAKHPEKGCFFGERSLLKKEKRAATAKVISDSATALALTKDRFEELLGSLSDMIKEKEGNNQTRKSKVAGEKFKERAM